MQYVDDPFSNDKNINEFNKRLKNIYKGITLTDKNSKSNKLLFLA